MTSHGDITGWGQSTGVGELVLGCSQTETHRARNCNYIVDDHQEVVDIGLLESRYPFVDVSIPDCLPIIIKTHTGGKK